MKSTERHTAGTQTTDSAEYCKIEAIAEILQYSAESVICFTSAL
jgi:hypothetical protein